MDEIIAWVWMSEGTSVKFGLFETEGKLLDKWEIPTRKRESWGTDSSGCGSIDSGEIRGEEDPERRCGRSRNGNPCTG